MKRVLLSLVLAVFVSPIFAGEGMWLPLLLQQLNEAEMQSMGMKMTAEDIYSVNKGSLKDAIVHFGGFCTGEVISNQGLVLTNHHCGYRRIQSHSTLENNYLEDGFWAYTQDQELPNKGLFVTFIVKIEEVTEQILEGYEEGMNDDIRQALIDRNLAKAKQNYARESYQDVLIRPFFKGNQYYLFVTERYDDIRLVGAPPSSIGKFGADTDNWVWPRHTGDFSLFRIYAGPDNKPAAYSPDNVPFKPRHHLPVSLDGVEEGDFTLVFGFPGRTNEYLPAVAVEMQVDVLNPIKIGVREAALEVMDAEMRNDPAVKIKYASKQAGIANYWKKWIGQSQGIQKTNGVAKIREMEASFQERVDASSDFIAYRSILKDYKTLYQKMEPWAKTRDLVGEVTGRNIELFRLSNYLSRYVGMYESSGAKALEARKATLQNYLASFYKNYEVEVDKKVFANLMKLYLEEVDAKHIDPKAVEQYTKAGKDYNKWSDALYGQSLLLNQEKIRSLLDKGELSQLISAIMDDPAYQLCRSIVAYNSEVLAPIKVIQEQINRLDRQYMKALIEVFPEQTFYPDANSTMRITYGQVASYEKQDALKYMPVTYLEGIMEKYKPGDYEFDVPQKLIDLYQSKDYGPYADKNGKLPICFIGSNHTTNGNSGSPAIDAYGNLIGLNFDRAWEGTMSDLYYDASICRNIMVDARYILFVIDKYAGATRLVEEMTLVHPKG
ncbi:MAG: S46 family peptidase [Saprospiraceae bacterium]|nr:S46 family peptidase [Saprospiraceae bacterium]